MAFGVVVLALTTSIQFVFANHSKHFERGNAFSSSSYIPTSFTNDRWRLKGKAPKTNITRTLKSSLYHASEQCLKGEIKFSLTPLFLLFLHWEKKEEEEEVAEEEREEREKRGREGEREWKERKRKVEGFYLLWKGEWLSLKVRSGISIT